jgi:hypothetical protein
MLDTPSPTPVSPELEHAVRAALDAQAGLRARREALRAAVESGDPARVMEAAREYLLPN